MHYYDKKKCAAVDVRNKILTRKHTKAELENFLLFKYGFSLRTLKAYIESGKDAGWLVETEKELYHAKFEEGDKVGR